MSTRSGLSMGPLGRGQGEQDSEPWEKAVPAPNPMPSCLPPMTPLGDATSLQPVYFKIKVVKFGSCARKGEAGQGPVASLQVRNLNTGSVRTKRGVSCLVNTGLPSPAKFKSSDDERQDGRQGEALRPKGCSACISGKLDCASRSGTKFSGMSGMDLKQALKASTS
ncbi:hypothetical protein P7K49_031475, partial [Saguinus oedipus]